MTAKPLNPDFKTRYSKHGHGIDVRRTYEHLPFQPFWTWVTGKSLNSNPPRSPEQTWLKEWQLWLQIAWAYFVIAGSILASSWALHSDIHVALKAAIIIVGWVLVVNRTRGLLHTFHYTNHGASIANMKRARWIATLFMSVPILHTAWKNYHKIHAQTHHGMKELCTDNDPDQQFMIQHGFHLGMSETAFWAKLIYAPFLPKNIWAHLWFRIEQNFIKPGRLEIAIRATYWALFAGLVTYFGIWLEISLFLLFPLFFLTQHSSWIQHVVEHLWFPVYPEDTRPRVFVGAMTWGRFQGRPHPGKCDSVSKVLPLAKWWLLVFVVDLPIRLYSYVQDLPSHDFHHRSPRTNFWSIAQERAANEGRESPYGPMTETWGIWESLLVLRDHLCRQEHDPFGIFAWDKEYRDRISSRDKALAIAS